MELEKIRVLTRELVQLNELIETRTKDTQDDRFWVHTLYVDFSIGFIIHFQYL